MKKELFTGNFLVDANPIFCSVMTDETRVIWLQSVLWVFPDFSGDAIDFFDLEGRQQSGVDAIEFIDLCNKYIDENPKSESAQRAFLLLRAFVVKGMQEMRSNP